MSDSAKPQEKQKSRFQGYFENVMAFLNDVYLGERTYNRVAGKFINAIKIFIVSSRKFLLDDCFTKASSIAYTTIISLIPTLTVALTFYSIFAGVGDKKEEIFNRITSFMLEHNIRLNIDPIIESISSLIENAAKIGGVGTVVLIFTATAVLRTLEKSLNDIWQVKKQRALFLKVIYYWAALTLGPIMLIAGTTAATQLSAFFSLPNYRSAAVTRDRVLWVAGNKAGLLSSGISTLSMQKVSLDRIDFDNQNIFEFDSASRTFREVEYRIEETDFYMAGFTTIQFIGDRGWAAGKNGLILSTDDAGANWSISKWGPLHFTSICMLDTSKGFIAAENGYLLKTEDGGKTWNIVNLEDFSSNLNSIVFYRNTGIITGDRGALIITRDGGRTWTQQFLGESKKKKRFANLNKAQFVDENSIWLVGDEGLIINSNDGGRRWTYNKYLEKNYDSLYFRDENTGYVGGENGTLIFTSNAGDKWTRMKLPSSRINQLVPINGGLLAVGDAGMILKTTDKGKTWQGIRGGNFIGFLISFFAPFGFIWLLFLLTYLLLPNIKIGFKAAAIGASFTGAVWVAFILLFIVYVKSFAIGTVAIYGGLAAIPLFLLMVYASTLIILYGAEISYTLMHPHTYKNIRKHIKGGKEITVFYGLSILYTVYRNFEKGKGATYFKDLIKTTSNKADEVDYFTALFRNENLITENTEGGYLPTNSSKNILIADVLDLIHDASLTIPAYAPSDSLKKYFHTLFTSLKNSRKEIVDETTLAQIIEEVG